MYIHNYSNVDVVAPILALELFKLGLDRKIVRNIWYRAKPLKNFSIQCSARGSIAWSSVHNDMYWAAPTSFELRKAMNFRSPVFSNGKYSFTEFKPNYILLPDLEVKANENDADAHAKLLIKMIEDGKLSMQQVNERLAVKINDIIKGNDEIFEMLKEFKNIKKSNN